MCDAARFGEHVLGKDPRQLVLADHHLHVDAEIVGRAEDFNDAADGRARGRGPTGDFDIDDQAFKALVLRTFRFWTSERLAAEHAMRRGGRQRAGFPRREE